MKAILVLILLVEYAWLEVCFLNHDCLWLTEFLKDLVLKDFQRDVLILLVTLPLILELLLIIFILPLFLQIVR